MYKVVIVDDEVKVAKLIKNLINWKELDLELKGIAHDGISALELIERVQPDIVITDIRIPGFDGVELIKRVKNINQNINFIIISGYKQFDYAQNAIKFGVKDYLLKPLNKEEINSVLMKVVDNCKKDNNQKDLIDNLICKNIEKNKELQDNIAKVLFFDEKHKELTIDILNEKYNFNFQEKLFKVIIVKVDLDYQTEFTYLLTLLHGKFLKVLKRSIDKICIENIICAKNGCFYCLLNFNDENIESIERLGSKLIEDLTLMKDVFKTFEISVCESNTYEKFELFYKSVKEAEKAMSNRIIQGVNRVIKFNELDFKSFNEIIISDEQKNKIVQEISILDFISLKTTIEQVKEKFIDETYIDGTLIYQCAYEIMDIVVYTLKNNHRTNYVNQELVEEFYSKLYMCNKIDNVFCVLIDIVERLICLVKVKIKTKYSEPVKIVQKYINENYYKAITLDEVSNLVGFNSTYFSSIFKKETNMTFLEYLTNIRVCSAKELLSDKNKSINEITFEVGYIDQKHFVKQFKKNTGLTPAKYRKLYF